MRAGLDALAPWERLEDLSERFGLPHAPEYEAGLFGRLYAPELRRALSGAKDLAERGRLKRLLGDPAGAREDLRAALDAEPERADALAWLGELALGRPEAVPLLSRAAASARAPAWADLYLGAALLLEGKAAQAAAVLARFRRKSPRSALGAMLEGQAARALGRGAAARACFARAARLAPSCAAAELLLARQSRGAARTAAFERALEADPDWAHVALYEYEPGGGWAAYLSRLEALAFGAGRAQALCDRFVAEETRFSAYHFEAAARAERLRAERPGRAWSEALVGRALSRLPPGSGRGKEALRALDAAARRAPRRGWTRAWRALGLIAAGRYAPALADLDAGLALQPYYYRAHAWRGGLLRRLGRVEEGLAALDRAVGVDARYPFSRHERSLARRALGDLPGAALDLDAAFRLDARYHWAYVPGREPAKAELAAASAELAAAVARHPSCVSLRVWRADALARAGERSAALRELESAVHADPQHGLAWARLGPLLVELGSPARAVEALTRARELEPALAQIGAWRADALLAWRGPAAARAELSAILAERPRAGWAWERLAAVELEDGRPSAALSLARRASRIEGRSAEAYRLEAAALLALGRLGAAEQSVARALTISPHLGRAYVLRAEIRRRQGRHADVLADYKLISESFPYLLNEQERAGVARLLEAA